MSDIDFTPRVRVTEFNDYLNPGKPPPPGTPYYVTNWTSPLSTTVIHEVCGGYVDGGITSETHRTFICRLCYLRISVPIRIETWGDLHNHFKECLS